MNIFNTHQKIIADYESYIRSFINVRDERIADIIDKKLEEGTLFPKPLIQFNPSFAFGDKLSNLCDGKFLHPDLSKIFAGYDLYKHQVEALRLGTAGKDFIVTSGTGSGKSLTYIGTIFDRILRQSPQKKGIKAIIVYPMNALINSQTQEFEKYRETYLKGRLPGSFDVDSLEGLAPDEAATKMEVAIGTTFPITFKQYTGQEGAEKREAIKQHPPDILMTNYMMLELIMTRLGEASLRAAIQESLEFLVFDELHTYRGRQGADVAMLIRRIRAFVARTQVQDELEVQCIGTSATMSSGGDDLRAQKEEVAKVGELIFGKKFTADQVVNESLTRVTGRPENLPDGKELAIVVEAGVPTTGTEQDLKYHPLSVWLENYIGLEEILGATSADSWLRRRQPITFEEAVAQLATASRLPFASCDRALKNLLAWAEVVNEVLRDQGSRKAYFPFRLHQFISQTGSVYLTLENKDDRKVSLQAGQFIKGDKYDKQPIYQAVFSRITGHEFICVRKNYDEGRLETRGFNDLFDEEEEGDNKASGYLIPQPEGEEDLWRDELIESLPGSWYRHYKNGNIAVVPKYRDRIPTRIWYDAAGNFSDNPDLGFGNDQWAWFMPTKLLFDPTAGVFYDAKSSEGTKLMRLGNEGRSTATTTLSLATVQALNDAGVPLKDQKLLSFTDNRQDASLQSGHYNDFVSIGRIRSAIQFALLDARNFELTIDLIAEKVFQKLGLEQEDYAQVPAEFAGKKRENEEVFKDFLTLRILQDLKRGWRYTMPNLEQCALLEIDYKYLKDEVAEDKHWADIPILNQLDPAGREAFLIQTLDYIRTSNAIYHRFFFDENRTTVSRIKDSLKGDWTLGANEKLEAPNYVRPESIGRVTNRSVHTASIGKLSNWGKYVADQGKPFGVSFNLETFPEFAHQLFGLLTRMGMLRSLEIEGEKGKTTGYILDANVIIWRRGDLTTIRRDKVRLRSMGTVEQLKPNKYFQDFYLQEFSAMKPLIGREHTGQVNHVDRIEREQQFREGKITTLFCSPTMELGIDISNLNVVHMRNVPPNPANYAQRSGRAGRSGQGALVITYCSQLSAHDQHYFKHQAEMVAGKVVAPRINIDNEELLKSHVHATYLLEAGIDLRSSLTEIVDLNDDQLRLREEVRERLTTGHAERSDRVVDLFTRIMQSDNSLRKALSDDELRIIVLNTPNALDAAMERWRNLYRNAVQLRDESRTVIDNPVFTRFSDEKKQAGRSERFAKNQIDGLRNEGDTYSFSEFYPFRYLASEGFLPGYNFTRLPIRTALESGETAQFLSRPRLLALREFGPRNIIYHNGQSYQVDRLNTTDLESKRINAKVANASGYIMMGEEFKRETCPITGDNLNNGGGEILYRLVEMEETSSKPLQRISCEEEERRKNGYDIKTYFSLPHGLAACDTIQVKSGEQDLLNIFYMPTTTITQVNKKMRRGEAEQFFVDKNYGYFATKAQEEKDEEGRIIPISLYADIVTNALYIQPTQKLGTDANGIITLQYALKRALEETYQVESNEIGVELMGAGELANIMIYEASEGSLGILSQLANDKDALHRLLAKAYEICYFEDGFDTRDDIGPATYNDLLSYYNQRDHEKIDRHLIKEVLENLMTCDVVLNNRGQVGNYEVHYKHLLATYDTSSSTELRFLEFLYKRGLRLPDKAQPRLSDAHDLYVMPDFQYDKHVFVFCDGTPHDQEDVKKGDRAKRRAMRDRGLRAIIYHYQDDLDQLVEDNRDVFIPVK
jgi:superfamily II DNA/RNA helicase